MPTNNYDDYCEQKLDTYTLSFKGYIGHLKDKQTVLLEKRSCMAFLINAFSEYLNRFWHCQNSAKRFMFIANFSSDYYYKVVFQAYFL